jgi:hypothetical protein
MQSTELIFWGEKKVGGCSFVGGGGVIYISGEVHTYACGQGLSIQWQSVMHVS